MINLIILDEDGKDEMVFSWPDDAPPMYLQIASKPTAYIYEVTKWRGALGRQKGGVMYERMEPFPDYVKKGKEGDGAHYICCPGLVVVVNCG